MSETADLEALAAQVRKSLHWAVFLLACMALILVVDLQLKRSIARTAVELSDLINKHTVTVKARAGGRIPGPAAAAGGDGDHGGVHSGGDVVRDPAVAPADDHQGGTAVVPQVHLGRVGEERSPGDG